MNFQVFKPDPRLSRFIRSFWILDDDVSESNRKIKVVPFGAFDLIFQIGSPYQTSVDKIKFHQQPHVILCGEFTRSIYLKPSGKVFRVGISFTHYAGDFITDCPKHHFKDNAFDFSLLQATESRKLFERIGNMQSPAMVVRFLNAYYLKKLEAYKAPDLTEYLTRRIISVRGNIRIDKLLSESHLTVRRIEQLFKTRIGVDAKFLCKKIRFQHAMDLIFNNADKRFYDLTYQLGYADQAHFIRDFKEFTGVTPTKLGHLNRETDQSLEWSQFFAKLTKVE